MEPKELRPVEPKEVLTGTPARGRACRRDALLQGSDGGVSYAQLMGEPYPVELSGTFVDSRAGDETFGRFVTLMSDRHVVVQSLRALPDTPVTVIHGDLIPPNIHVDATGRPTAILDFGCFTTAGDPAFEAAVTAAVWDMYGPHADEHVATLTHLFATELHYAPETLALYQTAYALTTYDLFTSDGSGGHFRWCVALLNHSSP